MVKLSGKNCLVTGASTGLGLSVSKKFTKMGANIILVCRNQEKGEKSVFEVKRETPNASVDLMICDLASMASIQNFIIEFLGKYSKLDVLFNNAAVMKKKRTLTEDGFEMMFQVNYLAPFMLMDAFQENLKNSFSPLIINNGRPADKYRLDFDDLQFSKKYQMYDSFFVTKLCLLFANLDFSRRHASDDISTIMVDPGPFKSNLARDVPLVGWGKNLFSAPVDHAAENILFVATLDEAKEKSGKVFKEKQEYPLTSYWKDTTISDQLWLTTEKMIENFQVR